MAVYATQKAALAAMIEATQEVLGELSERQLDSGRRGPGTSHGPDTQTAYATLRRIKSNLQRSFSPKNEHVVLDLDPTEMAVLASCCARGAQLLEMREGPKMDPRELAWSKQRRDLLVEQVLGLATGPLAPLPLPPVQLSGSTVLRDLRVKLHQKLSPKLDQETPIAPPPVVAHTEIPANSPTFRIVSVAPQRPEVAAAHATAEIAPDLSMQPTTLATAPRLLDARLRSIAAMDFRALGRAEAAQDFRLASVHLASLLEAATLDCAMQRANELGLGGRADAWDLTDVLVRLIGERCTARDRATISFLFAGSTLVRPTLQLHTPLLVTPELYRANCDYVGGVFRLLGCSG